MDFPHEGFIQNTLESYFDKKGFIVESIPYTDYAGIHMETGEKWRIEAKGFTSNVGLDFRTGLGQLIQRMDDPNANYGIAIPNIPSYIRQVEQIRPWVRKKFELHVLVVSEEGDVQHLLPENPLTMEEH